MKKVKLLLLGTGESGKSTIFRQIQHLHGQEETQAERDEMIPVVYHNLVSAMRILCQSVIDLGLTTLLESPQEFEAVSKLPAKTAVDAKLGACFKTLWADPAIQETWRRRTEYQIVDSVSYFFGEPLDRIAQEDYHPTQDDIIHVRVRTTGTVTAKYVISDAKFEMYDVGGQRNERKKWIHCFDNVTAVLFIAAISEYDQKLFEDERVNRMEEALDLFQEIANCSYFTDSSIILFLNKRDLYQEKVARVNIRDVPGFSDFEGKDGCAEDGVEYFLSKFKSRVEDPNKAIYHHLTCACWIISHAATDLIKASQIPNKLGHTGGCQRVRGIGIGFWLWGGKAMPERVLTWATTGHPLNSVRVIPHAPYWRAAFAYHVYLTLHP
ncbi:unnamed protein product [Chrysoparadoxa australica]